MRLNPERARLLRDKERGLHRSGALAPSGTHKRREIRFGKLPPDQVERARELLARLPGLEVGEGSDPYGISVSYEIEDHTQQRLEEALRQQGFHLSNALYTKLVRALVYYCEETQLRNLHGPQRLLKKSHEVYCQVWDHHLHGDHDETPPDLRREL